MSDDPAPTAPQQTQASVGLRAFVDAFEHLGASPDTQAISPKTAQQLDFWRSRDAVDLNVLQGRYARALDQQQGPGQLLRRRGDQLGALRSHRRGALSLVENNNRGARKAVRHAAVEELRGTVPPSWQRGRLRRMALDQGLNVAARIARAPQLKLMKEREAVAKAAARQLRKLEAMHGRRTAGLALGAHGQMVRGRVAAAAQGIGVQGQQVGGQLVGRARGIRARGQQLVAGARGMGARGQQVGGQLMDGARGAYRWGRAHPRQLAAAGAGAGLVAGAGIAARLGGIAAHGGGAAIGAGALLSPVLPIAGGVAAAGALALGAVYLARHRRPIGRMLRNATLGGARQVGALRARAEHLARQVGRSVEQRTRSTREAYALGRDEMAQKLASKNGPQLPSSEEANRPAQHSSLRPDEVQPAVGADGQPSVQASTSLTGPGSQRAFFEGKTPQTNIPDLTSRETPGPGHEV